MIEAPNVVDVRARRVACIPLVVPTSEIREVMGPGIQEVYSVLAAQGIVPAGPWMTHHRRPPSDVFDFEICVPVDQPIQPSGRVINGEIAAGTAASTVYVGPYEELGEGWGELTAWIEAQGLAIGSDLWEIYAVGPESGDDSSKYRTELFRRLAG